MSVFFSDYGVTKGKKSWVHNLALYRLKVFISECYLTHRNVLRYFPAHTLLFKTISLWEFFRVVKPFTRILLL